MSKRKQGDEKDEEVGQLFKDGLASHKSPKCQRAFEEKLPAFEKPWIYMLRTGSC
jgi:hypothetical protein